MPKTARPTLIILIALILASALLSGCGRGIHSNGSQPPANQQSSQPAENPKTSLPTLQPSATAETLELKPSATNMLAPTAVPAQATQPPADDDPELNSLDHSLNALQTELNNTDTVSDLK